jgi:hypothetical protein
VQAGALAKGTGQAASPECMLDASAYLRAHLQQRPAAPTSTLIDQFAVRIVGS